MPRAGQHDPERRHFVAQHLDPTLLLPGMPSDAAITPSEFRALFEAAPGSYLVLTPELEIVAVSDAYLRATMTERSAIVGRKLFEVFPDNPGDPSATGVANLRESLERVIKNGVADAMAVQKYDIRRPASEGGGFEERYWSPMNWPVFVGGRVKLIIHSVEDVTEFMRLKLQRIERDRASEELRTRTAHMEAEVYRRAQDLQEANRQLRELHSELESRVAQRTSDLSLANQNLQREISERERAEQALEESEAQLRQSQKLEAIGRLAGGVAHDFNNLLSVILGYGELVQAELDRSDKKYALVAECIAAGQRAARLTHQLLAFSRKQIIAPTVVELNTIVAEMDRMLRRLIGENIEFGTVLRSDLGRIKVDPGQIEQVIVNLVINARDAMPAGGRLTIETANVELDESYVRRHVGTAIGPHVMLAVSDTGIGMDDFTKTRVFEPFFTTKEQGKGTGLGLATVYGIVKQSGGSIWVYSEPGRGSTFKIYFPRVHDPLTPRVAEPIAPAVGHETILLVEDDASLRGLVKLTLADAGFRVLDCADPREALRLVADRRDPIGLVLTDVVMPGMSGKQMSDALHRSRSDLKVLFMSGYTDNGIAHQGILDAGVAFLQKPFTPAQLRRRVRDVLDAPATPRPNAEMEKPAH
jgi:signal transduction histidine kinase/ActR/RegA family two-component response regulator